MNRNNRLKKGIASLEEQIALHEQKKAKAEIDRNEELAGYYTREIEKFRRETDKKKQSLDK